MSVITEHGTGYTEKDLIHNWAAEYAKRLNDSLSDTVENYAAALEGADRDVLAAAKEYTDTELKAPLAAAAAAQTAADAAKTTADNAKITADTAKTTADAAKTIADTAQGTADAAQAAAVTAQSAAEAAQKTADSKLGEIPIASLDTLGGIKLYGKSVNGVNTNRSGLSIGDDGSMLVLVKASGGLAIDGAGQLYIKRVDSTGNILNIVDGGLYVYAMSDPDALFELSSNTPGRALDAHLYAEQHTYSTTPVRVGTWLDGNPVWRVAIPYTQMIMGMNGLTVNAETGEIFVNINNLVSTFTNDRFLVTAITSVQILGYSEWGAYIREPVKKYAGIVYFSTAETPEMYEDYITYENGYWGGWLEFVTPQSNIS
ncbi:MAG: hypothetical protein ACI38A_01115 [Candidatus Ornithomonoglobus sp.]